MIALIIGNAKSIKVLLEGMTAWSEPNRMNAMQVIVDHQIGCCRDAEVCRDICAHLGVETWYCQDFDMNHAWAVAKIKDASGKTKLYIMNNGYAEGFESEQAMREASFGAYIKGTREGMEEDYPF